MAAFEELGLMTELSSAIQELDWKFVNFFFLLLYIYFFFSLPTDIQSEAIPTILGGSDILMVNIF